MNAFTPGIAEGCAHIASKDMMEPDKKVLSQE